MANIQSLGYSYVDAADARDKMTDKINELILAVNTLKEQVKELQERSE